MAEIIQYGFKDNDDNYDEAVFPDTEYEKAVEYAKKNRLLLVEDHYEWQETIEKDDFREKSPTGPAVDDALSAICHEAKHALRMGISLDVIKGQLDLAADEVAEGR